MDELRSSRLTTQPANLQQERIPSVSPNCSTDSVALPSISSARSTEGATERSASTANVWLLASCFAAALCLLHLLLSGRYGYFRDELYYAACGRHLAWGYVDHAPLIAVIAWLSNRLFGASLFSLRLFPALSSAAKIILTAWMVRELGGKRYAQILAATLIFFCPIYLVMDNFLSMNSFEPLFWMGAAAVVMRIANPQRKRPRVSGSFVGVIAGIGILNKHSMLLFGSALILGLLVSSGFRYFRNPWILLGALIALIFFAPNLLWEIRNHLPTLEMLRNARIAKNAYVPWYEFIAQQALLILPLAAPVFVAGLWFFFATPQGKTVSLSRLDLRFSAAGDVGTESAYLLSRAGLPHVLRGWRVMDREQDCLARVAVGETGRAGANRFSRDSLCAIGVADFAG